MSGLEGVIYTDLTEVKAKTDNMPFILQLYQRQGIAVNGTWTWSTDANGTDFATQSGDTAGYWEVSIPAINNEYDWEDVFLPSGNYIAEIIAYTATNRGIITLKHGVTTLGTVDLYSASTTYNVKNQIAFSIATAASADLKIVMATKNASSTNYGASIQRFVIKKVA